MVRPAGPAGNRHLGGPPLLGYLGDHTGVLYALLAVAAFLVPALLAVPAVREPGRGASER